MNTKIKLFLLLLPFCFGFIYWAENVKADQTERPLFSGNPGESGSVTGVTVVSTKANNGTAGTDEMRRIKTANNGILNVYFGVSKSTTLSVPSSSSTDTMDGVHYTSTFTVAGNTNAVTNPNVFAIATTSEPVMFRGYVCGNVTNPVRLRVWDSRGSTSVASVAQGALPIINRVVTTSGTAQLDYNVWFTSGVTAHLDPPVQGDTFGSPNCLLLWDETKKR